MGTIEGAKKIFKGIGERWPYARSQEVGTFSLALSPFEEKNV